MGVTVIGLTGSFGSGCSYIAEKVLSKCGYKRISLSDILKDEFSRRYPEEGKPKREQLQDFGDQLRMKDCAYLARRAVRSIKKDRQETRWIVDSIRNPHEVAHLKEQFVDFYLFAVFADVNTRWERVMLKYHDLGLKREDFEKDDARDAGDGPEHGQRVTDCYILADAMVANEELHYAKDSASKSLQAKVGRLHRLVDGEVFEPTYTEALMAMAFANSLRSSCVKRKVGAVITDKAGHIFSSGYNEVPSNSQACREQGGCYREVVREELRDNIEKEVGVDRRDAVLRALKPRFKNLDYCRALHAEESAILNVARFGSARALEDSVLYVTTYPCNLCANKIVQVGIRGVVYLEPYPMQEAKKTLSLAQVTQTPFEGVSFNGYFRFKQKVEL